MNHVVHKYVNPVIQSAQAVGITVSVEGRNTRCGEYFKPPYNTSNDQEVTCKRCLKGMAKDKRNSP